MKLQTRDVIMLLIGIPNGIVGALIFMAVLVL
jgi:hypothetical protein